MTIYERIAPLIWHQLKDDILGQINYHLDNQKLNGNSNPEWISTDLLIGDYKLVRIYEALENHEAIVRVIVEDASTLHAADTLNTVFKRHIGKSHQISNELKIQANWNYFPHFMREQVKKQVQKIFLGTGVQALLRLDSFEIHWDAYHGELTGDLKQMIEHTYFVAAWTGIILVQSEKFSDLSKGLAKILEEELSNDEPCRYHHDGSAAGSSLFSMLSETLNDWVREPSKNIP